MEINNHIFNAELEDIIQELRHQLALNNIEYLQKEPKQSGNSLQIQCPYHGNGQERRPSAGIRMSDGLFHCFSCNEVHTLPEVISFCFGHEDDYIGSWGWKWLVKNFITVQVEERQDIKLDLGRNKQTSSKENNIQYVSEEELDNYRWTHKYWKTRGITDSVIIELFDLGYDKKNKMITFPVRDIKGRCEFVAKRSVKKKFFQYPSGVSKPLYGLYELAINDRIKSSKTHTIGYPVSYPRDLFVCESMIDCILLWQSGYYAVALNGLGNERQFKQLSELPIRHIILATDNDEAGQKARQNIKKHVTNKIYTEIVFPEGVKDIGECTQKEIKNILNWEQI